MQRHTKQWSNPEDKYLEMRGKLQRGPLEFETGIAAHEGEIMAIATRNVISLPQTQSILMALSKMTECHFRRLPVTDPGTNKLRGIITSGDVINLMGGGDKFRLVQVKHNGNLISALNESVSSAMTTQVTTLSHTARIADAVDVIVNKKIGGMPILDDTGSVTGIVTERDILRILSSERSAGTIEDVMTASPRVTTPDSPVGSVTKEMTKYRFRRLPVVSDDVLYGIITATDIMRYLGSREVFTRLVTGDIAEVMGLPVRTLVAGELRTTDPGTSINAAAQQMLDRDIGALPVIEDSRLVGLVTEFDLVRAFAGSGSK